jgi:hypothetical protein
MMEFTYDGMVRYGFGFYNPNHAAALICALMPFLWAGWQRWKHPAVRIGLGTGMVLLLIALAMTYSRSGFLILLAEVGVFLLLTKLKNWKLALGIVAGGVLIFALGGVMARFVLDRSVTNRLDICLAGLQLFAANPRGTGLGNSGAVASAFLLPEGIVCRTLVNSHLTLLAEFGIIIGFVWCGSIIYALLNGTEKPAAYTAFTGILLAAGIASVFDWDVLFDFHEFGMLPVLNYILSWGLFLYFIGLLVYLSWGTVKRKKLLIAGGGTLFLLLVALSFSLWPGSKPPKVIGREFVLFDAGSPQVLVLYDSNHDLRSARKLLNRYAPGAAVVMPLNSWQFKTNIPDLKTAKVFLIGECGDFASHFPEAEILLYHPSEYQELTGNVREIFIPAFDPHYNEIKRSAEAKNIQIHEI